MKRALLALVLLAGCATLRKDTTVCPEHRNLRCMTDTECSMDEKRGCRVCACREPEDDISRQPDQDEGLPDPTSD